MKEFLQVVSVWAIPLLVAGIPLAAMLRKVAVYEEFVEGAKEGFQTGVRIIPYLVAMLVAFGMFRASGAIEIFCRFADPLLSKIGMPAEILPLAMLRPFSGSASTGVFSALAQAHGGDSLIARMAGTIMGSTETTFYVLTVYFGSVGVYRMRHALWAGICADAAGILASVWICRKMFGGE